MPSILNEALEWLDRAEQAREVAGQLNDPGARKAVILGDFPQMQRQAMRSRGSPQEQRSSSRCFCQSAFGARCGWVSALGSVWPW